MIFGIAGFIIGTVLGSFGKVLADRSLSGKSFGGRSYCPKCQKSLAWYDLFPILSFALLKGKCRYCRKKIGVQYLASEVITGLLIAFLFWQSFSSLQSPITEFFGQSFSLQSIVNIDFSVPNFQFSVFILELLFKSFFIVILVVLFLTDIKKMFIPDRIVLPAILIGFLSLLALTLYKIGFLYFFLSQSVVGRKLLESPSDYFQRHAIIISEPLLGSILSSLAIAGFFMGLIIFTKGKGMGGGDVKLGAFMGVMLGFPGSVLALVLAFLTGAVVGIGLIVSGKKHFGQAIPFGPFLVLGSLAALFWGNKIIDWYLKLGY